MTDFKTPNDALVEALVLAVTAPTEDQSKMAVELAEKIAAGLSEIEDNEPNLHPRYLAGYLSGIMAGYNVDRM